MKFFKNIHIHPTNNTQEGEEGETSNDAKNQDNNLSITPSFDSHILRDDANFNIGDEGGVYLDEGEKYAKRQKKKSFITTDNDTVDVKPSSFLDKKQRKRKSFFLPPGFFEAQNQNLRNVYTLDYDNPPGSTNQTPPDSNALVVNPMPKTSSIRGTGSLPSPPDSIVLGSIAEDLAGKKRKKSRISQWFDQYYKKDGWRDFGPYSHVPKQRKVASAFSPTDESSIFLPKKIRKRLVNKSGTTNVIHANIPKLKQHFLTDIYTTLLDSKWRWSVAIFALGFLISWFIFAFIWWLILFSHDDFDHIGDEEWEPCVKNIKSFAGVFLFSVEAQHTIGFGYRYITEACPEAIIIFLIQCICGTLVQGFITGMMFAKLCRPKKRAATLMFSRNCVICTRDGQLVLCVRIGDMRRSHMIGAHTKAYMFRKKVTLEGEIIHLKPYVINVGTNPPEGDVFLVWPVILSHIIDETSPFYDMSAQQLADDHFEMVFIFEGNVEATGASMQARTSYLPHEILWGYRFERLTRFITETGNLAINYERFHDVAPVNIPRCSARTLESLRKKFYEEEKKLRLQLKYESRAVRENNTNYSNNNNAISILPNTDYNSLELPDLMILLKNILEKWESKSNEATQMHENAQLEI